MPTLARLGGLGLALYTVLAAAGDLRARPTLYLAAHGVQLAVMLVAYRALAARSSGSRWVLVFALAFRIVAATGEPAVSDDVYRYVWDGRVQLHGIHPYRFAPTDPVLLPLRDADWTRINHARLPTIYPPLAQATFLLLAALGAGPHGFKLAFGLADFGVVLALDLLLRRLQLPRARLVLYAWNPLAVLESAGGGHVDAVGVLLLTVALVARVAGRRWSAVVGLALSIQVKLLPVVLVPLLLRQRARAGLLLLAAVLSLPWLPYALAGPAWPPGLWSYAERWERNGSVYPLVQAALESTDSAAGLTAVVGQLQRMLGNGTIPWERVHAHVWPRSTARGIVALLGLAWVVYVAARRRELLGAVLWTVGGVLLLGPVLHPWYLLWVLPWAAAVAGPGWLTLCALVPLAYLARGSDVSWLVRAVEYGLPALVGLAAWRSARAGDPGRIA